MNNIVLHIADNQWLNLDLHHTMLISVNINDNEEVRQQVLKAWLSSPFYSLIGYMTNCEKIILVFNFITIV